MYNIRYGLNYLRHRLGANNRHGIHSPFVYKLIDTVIYDYHDQKVYREIKEIAQKKHSDRRVINTLPLKFYRLLYRFTVYFNPQTILLADTEDYITEFVIKQANPEVQSISLAAHGIRPADMILADALKQGPANYLTEIMSSVHDDTVIIFTNIHRNVSAKKSWEQLKLNQQVRVTIDLYFIGLVFFKPGMSKEDFRVRY
ncbi:hypothetical protein SAMN05192574_106138 [Mucilaginibacter gossypiicola]|uniref:Uncharacterized protein n=1 Tax=Mucilaginibacter gossypiicola TaxID=551995 RepID=A0A1H8MXV4_9SPHI|nr:hypothetical protein [Mucilaginibacter gossypiicola]SEO22110.1 hypothetical protein SAMN05192574_106138 [Mucilaginibacter gossypiicola]